MIAWVRAHGAEHGADPGVLVGSGSSAGGHLALLAAGTQNDPEFQPGFESADPTVTAAVALNAYYGNYGGLGAETSPRSGLAGTSPPLFLAHGDLDTMVPVEAAREFAAAARDASDQVVVYVEIPGAQHAFDLFATPRFDAVVTASSGSPKPFPEPRLRVDPLGDLIGPIGPTFLGPTELVRILCTRRWRFGASPGPAGWVKVRV